MNQKNGISKLRNVALATILAAGVVGPTYVASAESTSNSSSTTTTATASSDSSSTTQSFDSILSSLKTDDSTANSTTTKEETVYVFTGADGAVKNTIVSDWLKNVKGENRLQDVSNLTDIQNTEGNQSFTTSATGSTLSWDAEGSDIYYQGNTAQAAPVTMKITYMLDGKTISPSELAGKSGKVTIRYDYTNNSKTTTTIDGQTTTIYTPFVAMTGLVLDNSNFKNVTVTNGKTTNDGDRTTVAGYALPGLQEDLNISKDKVDIPDYFEVSADVTNFKLATSATAVSSNLLNSVNTDSIDTSNVQSSIDSLSSAMTQLIDGSSSLYDGLNTLLSSSGTLSSGVTQLADGGTQLASGTSQLASGSSQVADGLSTLSSNSDSLTNGSTQLANGTTTLQTSTANLPAQSQALADGTAKLSAGLSTAVDGTTQLQTGTVAIKTALDVMENGGKVSDTKTSAGLKGAVAAIGTAGDTSATTLQGGLTRINAGLSQLVGTPSDTSGSLYAAKNGATLIGSGMDDAIASIGTGSTDTGSTLLKGTYGVGATLSALTNTQTGSEGALIKAQAISFNISAKLTDSKTQIDNASTALGQDGSLKDASDALSNADTALSTANGNLSTVSTDANKVSTDLSGIDLSGAADAKTALNAIASDTSLSSTEKAAIQKAITELDKASSASAGVTSAQKDSSTAATAATNAASVVATSKTAVETAQTSVSNAQTTASTTVKNLTDDSAAIAVINSSYATPLQQLIGGSITAVNNANTYNSAVDAGLKVLRGSATDTSGSLYAAKNASSVLYSGMNTAIAAIGDSKSLSAQTLHGGVNIESAGLSQLVNGTSSTTGLQDAVDSIGSATDTSSSTLMGGTNQLYGGLTKLKGDSTSGLTYAAAGASALATSTASLPTSSSQLVAGIKQLTAGAATLSKGLSQYTGGVDTLNASYGTLDSGISSAASGAKTLSDGINTLQANMPALTDGVQQLTDGSGQLKDGLTQFNDEGVQKIVDAYNDNLKGLNDRLKATVNAGKSYDTFSGKSQDMNGTVKFIIETDSIGD